MRRFLNLYIFFRQIMWLSFLLKHFLIRSLSQRFFHFGRLSVLFYARRAFGASVCVIFNFLFLNKKKLKYNIRSYANLKTNEIIIAILRISILKIGFNYLSPSSRKQTSRCSEFSVFACSFGRYSGFMVNDIHNNRLPLPL